MQLKTKKFHIYSCEVKCSCGGIQAQGLRGGEGGKGRRDEAGREGRGGETTRMFCHTASIICRLVALWGDITPYD